MAQVYLRRLSRWQAEQQRDAVADVYVSAYHGAAGAEYRDRQGFLTRFEKHGRLPDFDMVVADSGGLVGCVYGFRADRTGDWWAGFRGDLPTEFEELTASGRAFVLAELMVLPAHRRHGVATDLQVRLVTRHDTDLIVAAVDLPDPAGPEAPGSTLLRSWGWLNLGTSDPGDAPGARGRQLWVRRPLR
ncbi:hypothetical protein ACFRAO_05000 [Streptomyces sp. NPDC056656]|uniref:hypothetical protein n=1 Tax=Streptomyces sp. NPDC056656 TaxID=3345895 RepID=UPI0036B7EA06